MKEAKMSEITTMELGANSTEAPKQRVLNNKMNGLWPVLIVFALLLVTIDNDRLAADPVLSPDRPKIALVLSGGGARGAAHVGVLKVLEENQVPVDLIVGNSMGSIVGGMYALGMSPIKMENILKSIDWKDLFTDRPLDKDLSFRDKRDRQRFAHFEIGVKKGKIALPKGIIAGQKLNFLLRSLTLQSTGMEHFDELPIPFRAVATDINTGEMVLFEKGSLADAMRASMSVPGVFSPVEIEGRVLIDGGVVNNIPIDVAKQMGVDTIVAVNVGLPLSSSEELDSVLAISMQTLGINSAENFKKQVALLGENDLLISVNLEEISSADFHRVTEIIELGEKAAKEFISQLTRYSVSTEEYQRYLMRQRRDFVAPIRIDIVEVKAPERVSIQAVKSKIKTKPGEILDLETIEKDLTRIYAIGDFEEVDFRIIKEANKKKLLIDTKAKSWGPNYLHFGLNIIDDFQGASYYSLLAEYTMTQLNRLGAEWKTELQLGKTLGVSTELYQPLTFSGLFFLSLQFRVGQTISDVYSDDTRIGQYRLGLLQGTFDIGINFGTWAELTLGITGGKIYGNPLIGSEDLDDFDITQSTFAVGLDIDQLDNSNFPRYGHSLGSNLYLSEEFLGADASYQKFEIGVVKTTSLKRHTFLALFRVGSGLESEIPSYDEFSLGGFLNLSGYREGRFSGDHGGLGTIVYYYQLAKISAGWGDAFYVGGSVESGGVWGRLADIDFADLLLSGSIFVGVDTIFGPLYLAWGIPETSPVGRFYLFLGHVF
jgi:NTE family protein